jgi:hypothetical protein
MIAALCVAALPLGAVADPWSTPSGENSRFAWSNGANVNDLYGDPSISAVGLSFDSPNNYVADGVVVADDTASVMVDTRAALGGPADAITELTILQTGTWTDTYSPSDYTVIPTLFLLQADGGTGSFAGVADVTFLPGGIWEAELTWTDATGWNAFDFVFETVLQVGGNAAAGTGTLATTGTAIIVPEPATALFMLVAAASVIRRKR